jgi:hypothetical protein
MNRWQWAGIVALVAGSLVAEQLVHHEHHYWFTDIPGFFVVYGFVGCVAIIFLSKWYGKFGVQRAEDYYERHGDDDPHEARTGVADPGLADGATAEGVEER